MTSVLFTNVRIFDGTGALAYPGEAATAKPRLDMVGEASG